MGHANRPGTTVRSRPGTAKPASEAPLAVGRRAVMATLGLLLGSGCSAAAPHRAAAGPDRSRLFTRPGELEAAKAAAARDPLGRAWQAALLRDGDRILAQSVATRAFEPRRPVMLPTSRLVLTRVQTLAVAAEWTGERRFADRAAAEIQAACAFPDWNPRHFLDVAEMATAVAFGLSWLGAAWSPADRERVVAALVDKGLRPGLAEFEQATFWTRASHNWNLVCNGGLTAAAVALLDDTPDLARQVLARTLPSARLAFASYRPDGGWPEGPNYWEYATQYAVWLLAALESAGLDDGGLAATPGFLDTWRVRRDLTGPTGLAFNFSDSGDRFGHMPGLGWLARRSGDPEAARAMRAQGVPPAFNLLWLAPAPTVPAPEAGPVRYRGIQLVTLRDPADPDALWLAAKGGDNAANHSHLDLGSFVLDAHGQRFALDLGPDDYALPGYFDRRRRFGYYRCSSRGHNLLLFDDANQDPTAKAAVIGLRQEPGLMATAIDLSAAWPGLGHRRGFVLAGRQLAIVDEAAPGRTTAPRWQMHTRAAIAIEDATARLTLGGQTIALRIAEPPGLAFRSGGAAPPTAAEAPNTGISRLEIALPTSSRPFRLVVLVSLDPAPADLPGLAARPIADWDLS